MKKQIIIFLFAATDIWSAGIVVLEMANERVPNHGNSLKALWEIATKPPPTLNTTDVWSADIKACFTAI